MERRRGRISGEHFLFICSQRRVVCSQHSDIWLEPGLSPFSTSFSSQRRRGATSQIFTPVKVLKSRFKNTQLHSSLFSQSQEDQQLKNYIVHNSDFFFFKSQNKKKKKNPLFLFIIQILIPRILNFYVTKSLLFSEFCRKKYKINLMSFFYFLFFIRFLTFLRKVTLFPRMHQSV